MKLLYIAVHSHQGWGTEHWVANAFERLGCTVERYDYRSRRKKRLSCWLSAKQLAKVNQQFAPDAVLVQRAEKMPASIPAMIN